MSKTPVSVLQEHSAKNKLNPPKYVLVSSDINKSFTYAVSFAGMIAEGVGRSKQEAKQNAAENLLQKIPDIEYNMSGEYVQLLPSRPHISVENIHTSEILQKLGLCNKQSTPCVRSPQVHIPEKSINAVVGEKRSLPEAYEKIENHIFQAELEVYHKSKNSIVSQSQLQTGIEKPMGIFNNTPRKGIEDVLLNANKTEKIDASNLAPTPSLSNPSQLDDNTDSVSYLRNICLEKGYPLPNFACLPSEHDPAEFEAICQVGVIVLSAKGCTKKDAKLLVAREMVNSLQKHKLLNNSNNTPTMNCFMQSEEERLRKKLNAYARSKKHLNCGKMFSDSTLADRHNYFLTLEECIRNNGKNIIAQPCDDPKQKVQLLLKELGIVWKRSKTDTKENMLFIELDCGLDVAFAGEEKYIYPEILTYFRDML